MLAPALFLRRRARPGPAQGLRSASTCLPIRGLGGPGPGHALPVEGGPGLWAGAHGILGLRTRGRRRRGRGRRPRRPVVPSGRNYSGPLAGGAGRFGAALLAPALAWGPVGARAMAGVRGRVGRQGDPRLAARGPGPPPRRGTSRVSRLAFDRRAERVACQRGGGQRRQRRPARQAAAAGRAAAALLALAAPQHLISTNPPSGCAAGAPLGGRPTQRRGRALAAAACRRGRPCGRRAPRGRRPRRSCSRCLRRLPLGFQTGAAGVRPGGRAK